MPVPFLVLGFRPHWLSPFGGGASALRSLASGQGLSVLNRLRFRKESPFLLYPFGPSPAKKEEDDGGHELVAVACFISASTAPR